MVKIQKTLYCYKCRRTFSEINFYTLKTGLKSELCKSCETLHVNNFDPPTFLPILEKYDVPYLPWEWDLIRDKEYSKDPYKFNGKSVLGRYLTKMKLVQFKDYGYADSEKLQQEHEAEVDGNSPEKRIAEMQKSLDNGEISQEQFNSYCEQLKSQQAEQEKYSEFVAAMQNGESPQNNPYPANKHPFEELAIPNLSDELTMEDKIKLATKWGRLYSAEEWIYLEKKYNDFMKTFEIQGAARIDTLMQICKISLKANNALDSGNMEDYSKLMRVYDALMSSACFSESKKKEDKQKEFDSIGAVVAFAEKQGGRIERYKQDEPYDKIDEVLDNLKRYNKELILNDPSLARQLENYINRRAAVEHMTEVELTEDTDNIINEEIEKLENESEDNLD